MREEPGGSLAVEPGQGAEQSGRMQGSGVLAQPERIEAARELLARARTSAIDRLAALAAKLTGAPSAQVSMLTDEQVLAGAHGIDLAKDARSGPLEASLCTVAVRGGSLLAIADAPADARVAHLPPVTSGQVGAYLGVPVVVGGHAVGALCVHGPQPRPWKPDDVEVVVALAEAVAAELELGALAADAVATGMRLDLGFAAANVGSFDWDLRTDELRWDDRLRELFGYREDDFVPHIESFTSRVHPDDRGRVEAAVAAAVQRGSEYAAEYRVVLPGGSTRWVAARGRALVGPDGRAERLLGAAYDTTAVRTASDRTARLLETMSSAFYSVDADWRFTYVNGPAERLVRRGRAELLGRSLWDEFPDVAGTPLEEHYRRAARTGENVAFEQFYPPLDTWFEIRAWPSPDGLSIFFHDISARVRAQEEQALVHERLELLSSAGSRLSGTLEVEEVLDVLGDLVLPRLGEWLAVALRADLAAVVTDRATPGRDDDLRVVRVATVDEGARDRLGERLLGTSVAPGPSGTWAPVPGAGDRSGALARTLTSRGRTIGALVVGGPPPEGPDRDLLGDLAVRAGVALDNAVLYGAERRAAIALQRSLLPSELPQVPGVVSAARYLPGTVGRDIGGDFYFGQRLGDGRLLMAIGDVMGHGMQAAAQMGQLRAVLTAYGLDGEAPERVLARVALRAGELLDVGMATVALLIYDPATRRLTVASAGHPPPLVAPLDAAPAYLDVRPGPPIGAGPADYASTTVDLARGATVVLYTDGLIENRTETIDAGLDRLRDALLDVRLPPEGVCELVLRKLDRTAGAADDLALLVFSHA